MDIVTTTIISKRFQVFLISGIFQSFFFFFLPVTLKLYTLYSLVKVS